MFHSLRLPFGCAVLILCAANPSQLRAETVDQAVLALRPLAYWRLSDGERRSASDQMARHVGRYRGGVSRSGRDAVASEGNACGVFDGARKCVIVPHAEDFELAEGTISLWCKPARLSGRQGLFSKDASGLGSGGHLTIYLNGARIHAQLQSVAESFEIRSTEIPIGQWTHVAFSFGRVGMQLYVDGSLAAYAEYPGGLAGGVGGPDNQEPIALAASTMRSAAGKADPLTDFFRGSLDEVAVFPKPLGVDAVQRLAAAAEKAAAASRIAQTPRDACPHCGGFHAHLPVVRVQPRPLFYLSPPNTIVPRSDY